MKLILSIFMSAIIAMIAQSGFANSIENPIARTAKTIEPTDEGIAAPSSLKSAGWQRVHLGSSSQQYDFPVYANHALDGDLHTIREVIFVQHGLQRNGDDYYAAAAELLKATGRDPEEILLIAPNFPGTADTRKGFVNMPTWSGKGWMSGENAVNASFSVSSLQVLDDLLAFVTDKNRLPAVVRVTVAGHSGGAQLVHRYAVLNNVDEGLRARGIALTYVIANPSSYLYFTADRPNNSAASGFAPYDTAVCADYDKYRYGMRNMVPYAQGTDGMSLYRRYAQRNMTYLVGSDDNDPNHPVLDKACGAEAEGATRLQRARAYWRYERLLATPQKVIQHQYFEVVGVGHNQSKMLGSRCGALAIFALPESKNMAAASCRVPQ